MVIIFGRDLVNSGMESGGISKLPLNCAGDGKGVSKGAVRIGRVDLKRKSVPIYYLSFNVLQRIEDGDIEVTGHAPDGSLEIRYSEGSRSTAPKTVWNMTSHDAGSHGTNMVRALLPARRFPFPKSLYAVEDALRFFVKDKPDAVVLDFFSGSGTTSHAVMRLNRQDGGHRQCISVTNNEVAATSKPLCASRGIDLAIQSGNSGESVTTSPSPAWKRQLRARLQMGSQSRATTSSLMSSPWLKVSRKTPSFSP